MLLLLLHFVLHLCFHTLTLQAFMLFLVTVLHLRRFVVDQSGLRSLDVNYLYKDPSLFLELLEVDKMLIVIEVLMRQSGQDSVEEF